MTSSVLVLLLNGKEVCKSMYSGIGSAFIVWLLECMSW